MKALEHMEHGRFFLLSPVEVESRRFALVIDQAATQQAFLLSPFLFSFLLFFSFLLLFLSLFAFCVMSDRCVSLCLGPLHRTLLTWLNVPFSAPSCREKLVTRSRGHAL